MNVNGSTTETTIYVAGVLEKVTVGSVTDWKHYVAGGTGVAAIVTRSSSGSNTTYYPLKDHLGSTDRITNSSGSVVVALSYDAFGKRRGSNWTGSPSSGDWSNIAATTRHGFTGHEQLDNLTLIHMNGRVQDPLIGRFISADPIIQAPYATQSFNRYTYVWNNPLSLSDPTGFSASSFNGARRRERRGNLTAGGPDAGDLREVMQYQRLKAAVKAANLAGGDFPNYGGGVDDGGFQVTGTGGSGAGRYCNMACTAARLVGQDVRAIGSRARAASDRAAARNAAQAAMSAGSSGFVINVYLREGETWESALAAGHANYLASLMACNGCDPQSTLQRNQDQHRLGVLQEVARLESEGFAVFGTEVYASTATLDYSRRYDIVVQNPETSIIFGVEVKTTSTGNFRVDPRQVAFDVETVRVGAIAPQFPELTITGVMYRGTCFSCQAGAAWRTAALIGALNAAEIPHSHQRSPLSGD